MKINLEMQEIIHKKKASKLSSTENSLPILHIPSEITNRILNNELAPKVRDYLEQNEKLKLKTIKRQTDYELPECHPKHLQCSQIIKEILIRYFLINSSKPNTQTIKNFLMMHHIHATPEALNKIRLYGVMYHGHLIENLIIIIKENSPPDPQRSDIQSLAKKHGFNIPAKNTGLITYIYEHVKKNQSTTVTSELQTLDLQILETFQKTFHRKDRKITLQLIQRILLLAITSGKINLEKLFIDSQILSEKELGIHLKTLATFKLKNKSN